MKAVIQIRGYKATVNFAGWRCDEDDLQSQLNLRVPVDDTPADPNPLKTAAEKAVKIFGGEILETPTVKRIEGRIY